MKRFLFAAGAVTLAVAVTVAQDTRPAQPPADPTQPGGKAAQPGFGKAARGPAEFQPDPKSNPFTRVTAAKMATLEEEFETIDAHREVRKAHVRAAEVALKGAELNLDLLGKAGGAAPQTEILKAKLEVETAKAQLEIRLAELKEVEVKIKYAKKRLEDAKAAGVRPNPFQKGDPPPVVPPPPAK